MEDFLLFFTNLKSHDTNVLSEVEYLFGLRHICPDLRPFAVLYEDRFITFHRLFQALVNRIANKSMSY